MQEVLGSSNVEIRVDTRIKTNVKVVHDPPDIFVLDKKRKKALLAEVDITSQDQLQKVEAEKYDLLVGEISQICEVVDVPYVMVWDGVVTKWHNKFISFGYFSCCGSLHPN